MIQPTYTPKIVCAALGGGLDPAKLRTWRERDQLPVETSDDEGWTRYTFEDLLRIAALQELVDFLGADRSRAAEVASRVVAAASGRTRVVGRGVGETRYFIALRGKDGGVLTRATSWDGVRLILEGDREDLQGAGAWVMDTWKLTRRTAHGLWALGEEVPAWVTELLKFREAGEHVRGSK